jgi:F-type H+-transporting ATPase subunit h
MQAQDAQLGAVKHFSTPSAPHAPALPSDLAGELAAYDAADPVRAPVKADAAAAAVDAAPGGGADEFLEMLAADEPEHGAHH